MNIYLGETAEGERIEQDVQKVKHLLLVGKTGTGKTEFVRAIIHSLVANVTEEDVKFCLFSDAWFDLESSIPSQYFLYDKKSSVAKDEDEANDLLNRILSLLKDRKQGKANDGEKVILLVDNNAFYRKNDTNDKLVEIVKTGGEFGVHVICTLQNISERDESAFKLFPSVLCGALCDERQTKLVLGEKLQQEWKPFAFVLKNKRAETTVKATIHKPN